MFGLRIGLFTLTVVLNTVLAETFTNQTYHIPSLSRIAYPTTEPNSIGTQTQYEFSTIYTTVCPVTSYYRCGYDICTKTEELTSTITEFNTAYVTIEAECETTTSIGKTYTVTHWATRTTSICTGSTQSGEEVPPMRTIIPSSNEYSTIDTKLSTSLYSTSPSVNSYQHPTNCTTAPLSNYPTEASIPNPSTIEPPYGTSLAALPSRSHMASNVPSNTACEHCVIVPAPRPSPGTVPAQSQTLAPPNSQPLIQQPPSPQPSSQQPPQEQPSPPQTSLPQPPSPQPPSPQPSSSQPPSSQPPSPQPPSPQPPSPQPPSPQPPSPQPPSQQPPSQQPPSQQPPSSQPQPLSQQPPSAQPSAPLPPSPQSPSPQPSIPQPPSPQPPSPRPSLDQPPSPQIPQGAPQPSADEPLPNVPPQPTQPIAVGGASAKAVPGTAWILLSLLLLY